MTADHAAAYFAAGWNAIPLPAGKKWPPPDGVTGWKGRYLASTKGYDWSGNIALRLPPDVVGLDVDVYAGGDRSLKQLEELYGPLPMTWWSTSRTDGSGIALFRVPFGTTLATDPAEGIDMVQAFHRYAVCAPSIHPEGRPYRWIDEQAEEDVDLPPHPADLPDLPWAWIEGLRALKQSGADPITPGAAREFVDNNTTVGRPGALVAAIRSLEGVHAGGRHDALVRVACWVARESAAGWYSAAEAFDRLHGWWVRAVSDDPRRADGGEFAAAVLWAIGQALADPQRLEQLRAELGGSTPRGGKDDRHDHRGGDDHRDQPHGDDDHPGDDEQRSTAENAAVGRNLPEEFWNARPELARIRQAAHAASLSADAVLGAALARVATLTPPTLTMDTGVGMPASMNAVIGLVGPSGAGKTTAVAAARQLVPIDRIDIVADIPLGSGEGLVDVFFETVTEEENGKKVRKKRKTKTAALVCLDEGQALAEMGGRKGATLMPTVRSSWSGETIGQANASEETKRIVKAGTYRLALVVGFQATAAGAMLADQETGTAQRFVLFSATDPTIPLEPIEWPTAAVLHHVPPTVAGQTITVDDAIKKEIRIRAHAIRTAAVVADPLDSHRDLNRLKIAGLLAILGGRVEISVEDWSLSALVMNTSDAVRTWVMETNTATAVELEEARTSALIKRQRLAASALDNDVHHRAVAGGARAIARLAHRRKGERITAREAARAPASQHRHEATVDEMTDFAEGKDWVRADGDGWVAGRSAPA